MRRYFNFRILHAALPFILANASIPLIGVMNIAIAGHLGSSDYLAALSIGSMVVGILFWWLSSLRMGTTGLIAQASGQGDTLRMNNILSNSFLLAIMISLIAWLCHSPILSLAYAITQPASSLKPLITVYFNIRLIGMPAVLINYIVIGSLIGLKQGRDALLTTLTLLVISTLFGVVLVYGCGWHNTGIAIADVIGQSCSMIVGLALLHRHHPLTVLRNIKQAILRCDKTLMINLISMQRDLFLRTVALSIGFGFFTVASTHLGTNTLAANTVLLNLTFFSAYFLDGFANVAEGQIGTSLGQGDRDTTYLLMTQTGVWMAVCALLIGVCYLTLGQFAIQGLTSIADIQMIARHYLPFAAALPCVAALSYWLDAIYVAALQQRHLRNSAIVAFVIFIGLHVVTDSSSNIALWSAFLCFFLSRGLYQLLFLKRALGQSLTTTQGFKPSTVQAY